MEIINTIWNVVEPITVILTLSISTYVFFKDPLRSRMFFGFRPTAVIILIDPDRKEVLFVLHRFNHNVWQFPQGGIYTPDVVGTIEGIIKRELNIDSNKLELENIYKLRTIKINGRRISEKNYLGMIKITKEVRGKGYFGCIVHADFNEIKKEIEIGYALKDYKMIKLSQAKKFLKDSNFKKKHPEKYDMTLDILDLIKQDIKI